jgi:PAS domain S-box-containing protein
LADENEEELLRSVALQNSRAVLLARERAERELLAAKAELERRSAELAEQREFFRITLSSIGDAVITTDAEARVTFLNPVAEAMTGWKSEEAKGLPLEKVFNIINEQTRRPAPSPVGKVLSEGKVVGLANHTSLISRDGRETAVEDSAAPILDAAGKIAGVVMVFHDATEKRRAEAALRESHEILEKRVQERTAELNVANESLRELSGRLQQLRDEERKQIARELHDSVGQMLAALGMNIATVRAQSHKLDAAGARCVVENAGLVEQISEEIRTLSHLLHPPLLEVAGLAWAVRWYADGFAERSKIKVTVDIPSEFPRLSEEVELAVFRLVQECLINIHRHSGSGTAKVSIREERHNLIVEIKDTGRGIPPDREAEIRAGRSGVGFRGMRERLRQFGGNLDIQSLPSGTRVSANIPLPPAAVSDGSGNAKR